VKRSVALSLALAAAACSRGGQQQQNQAAPAARQAPATAAGQGGVTPMAQRVAVLGMLNKRNGIVKDVALRPGQSVRWKDLLVRLRACETSAPWEEEKLTGAFVQVDVQKPDKTWNRVFSGWLYKESPSLNVVEHPVYDVWPKSCEMTYPAGPAATAAPASSSSRSSAPKSGGPSTAGAKPATSAPGTPEAPAAPPTAPSAAESNAT
jgi:hypothetical protein